MITGGLALAAPAAAQSATLVVDDDNDECPRAGYSTVQGAVADASADNTVEVCAGTYHESVTIPADKDGLTLEATGDATLVGPAGDHTRTVDIAEGADGVTIRGFTITNPDGRYGVFIGTFAGNGPVDTRIVDNVFEDFGTSPAEVTGIIAEGGTEGTEIVSNSFRGIRDEGGDGRATAVSITSETAPIQNVLVADNTFEDIS